MPPLPPRRLALVDAMILIVGFGCTFLLLKLYQDHYLPDFARRLNNISRVAFVADWYVGEAIKVGALQLAVLSLIGLLIRLRQPCPDWIVIFNQPGAEAYLAAAGVTAVSITGWVVVGTIMDDHSGFFFFEFTFARMLAQTGLVIAVMWLRLLLSRQWKPEPSLIDRAGRVLGVGWILLYFALTWLDLHQGFFQLENSAKYWSYVR